MKTMKNPMPLLTAAALTLGLAGPTIAASDETATIKRDEIQRLLEAHAEQDPASFNGFLEQVRRETDNSALQTAINGYLQDEPLEGANFVNLYRLLGLYTRLHYGDDVTDLLDEMVAIRTAKLGRPEPSAGRRPPEPPETYQGCVCNSPSHGTVNYFFSSKT